MVSLNQAAKQLSGTSKKSKTKLGSVGYDNSRENIDPHVKTQVVSTQEIGGSPVFTGGGLPFGEIYVDDNAVTTDLAAQDTWYDVTIFANNGQSNNCTPDHTDDSITIIKPGIYVVLLSLDARSAASNAYYFSIFKNKVAGTEMSNLETRRTTSVANKPGSASISGMVSLVAGDTISLGIKRTDGLAVTKSILLEHVNLSVFQVGG